MLELIGKTIKEVKPVEVAGLWREIHVITEEGEVFVFSGERVSVRRLA